MESHQKRSRPLRIMLLGYGKMGKLLASHALSDGHEVAGIIDSKRDLAILNNTPFDVGIDFTHSSAVRQHVSLFCEMKKNLVIGTTGWEHELPYVQEQVKNSESGVLYSPNFSIGIALFKKMVHAAGKIMQNSQGYETCGIESHHRQKTDAPSGTAKDLQNVLKFNGKEIPFHSIRCGYAPGTHSILFDSHEDSITLTHTARNREGFVKGALIGANWLEGKKGFFTMDDLISQVCHEIS